MNRTDELIRDLDVARCQRAVDAQVKVAALAVPRIAVAKARAGERRELPDRLRHSGVTMVNWTCRAFLSLFFGTARVISSYK